MKPELLAALKLLLSEGLGDWVYTIRDRAIEDPNCPPNSWDHPRVLRFSNAVQTIEAAVKTEEARLSVGINPGGNQRLP